MLFVPPHFCPSGPKIVPISLSTPEVESRAIARRLFPIPFHHVVDCLSNILVASCQKIKIRLR